MIIYCSSRHHYITRWCFVIPRFSALNAASFFSAMARITIYWVFDVLVMFNWRKEIARCSREWKEAGVTFDIMELITCDRSTSFHMWVLVSWMCTKHVCLTNKTSTAIFNSMKFEIFVSVDLWNLIILIIQFQKHFKIFVIFPTRSA